MNLQLFIHALFQFIHASSQWSKVAKDVRTRALSMAVTVRHKCIILSVPCVPGGSIIQM